MKKHFTGHLIGLLALLIIMPGTPVWGQSTSPEQGVGAVEVYLLAGQSNMQGVGMVDQLEAAWQEPILGAYFWNGEGFETLDPGSTRLSGRVGEFGPEIGFVKLMRANAPDREVYLIKFYRSGQPLHHGWDGNEWVGGEPAPGRRNFYPGEEAGDENTGVHYEAMLEHTLAALSHLRELGHEPVLAGVVWMQGEQDAKHEVSAGRVRYEPGEAEDTH